MDEYTPSETEVRDDYVAWEYTPERKAEFDRFLARVRRDAAREALDGLAAAEHRATRAEAQSAIRGRAVVMYRERAREAEAERDAARGYISELETAVQSRNDVIKHRDARIKAVRDVLDADEHVTKHMGTLGQCRPDVPAIAHDAIRRALDGDA